MDTNSVQILFILINLYSLRYMMCACGIHFSTGKCVRINIEIKSRMFTKRKVYLRSKYRSEYRLKKKTAQITDVDFFKAAL